MTELHWEGKYKDGKKVAPVRLALPFQTVETINESAADRKRNLESLFGNPNKQTEWRNRLIWGDKKYVLPSLLPEFAGKVNLIYIDPPFDTGANFSFTATIADHPETEEDETTSFVKEPSMIEQKAYRDTWGRGLDSYMQWFYETIVLLRELLAEDGSIYVHLDWHVGHYAKVIMDEVFGYENFRSEIIWKRTTAHSDAKYYGMNYDQILFYTKSMKATFNTVYQPYDDDYIARFKNSDPNGRKWTDDNLTAKGLSGGGYEYEYKGAKSLWRMPIETMKRLDAENRLHFTSKGGIRLKRYLDELPGMPSQALWLDINAINSQAKEKINYPTQKPEPLLERIIKASSNEDDLILDCFCGSGSTAAVSERMRRRWITCDLGRFSIHTARKRFLGIPNVKPFVVQNLGKYERQQWMVNELTLDGGLKNASEVEKRAAIENQYRNFILELYHAKSISGYTWLHGAKAGRLVHVGSVDAPVSNDDVKRMVQEFWKTVGKNTDQKSNGIDVLGWDFAFELNETASQFAAANKIDLKFKKIPREVLERKAVEQGDIKFFEMASLGLKVKASKNQVSVTLDNFMIPPDDVPQEVQSKITHWSQWVDYWSIDWNFKEDTFHNEWQSYRTRQNTKIELTTGKAYDKPGKYTILVKVIDILGNDTTKAVQVEIKG